VTGELRAQDHSDLTQLAASYAAAVDDRDWTRLAALFTPGAVLVRPDPPRSLTPSLEEIGAAAIVAAVGQLTAFARTFHHLTGSIWTSDGITATGRTTAEAHHLEAGENARSWVWHLIYLDRCVRGAAGWVFSRRELTIAIIEVRPVARVLPFATPPQS
jgi:hypothetical protein